MLENQHFSVLIAKNKENNTPTYLILTASDSNHSEKMSQRHQTKLLQKQSETCFGKHSVGEDSGVVWKVT